jgi:hypothetical protein
MPKTTSPFFNLDAQSSFSDIYEMASSGSLQFGIDATKRHFHGISNLQFFSPLQDNPNAFPSTSHSRRRIDFICQSNI